MEGVPVLVVSNHLGHSSPSITLDIYSHFIPEVAEIPSITFERVLKEANNDNN
jgi:integrase